MLAKMTRQPLQLPAPSPFLDAGQDGQKKETSPERKRGQAHWRGKERWPHCADPDHYADQRQ